MSILWIIDKKAYICAQKINIMIPIDKLGSAFGKLSPLAIIGLVVVVVLVYPLNNLIEFLKGIEKWTELGAIGIAVFIIIAVVTILYFLLLSKEKDRFTQVIGAVVSIVLVLIGVFFIYYIRNDTVSKTNKNAFIIFVRSKNDGEKSIEGADIFIDGSWLGSTDKKGRFVTQSPNLNFEKRKQNVKVVKEGYRITSETVPSEDTIYLDSK